MKVYNTTIPDKDCCVKLCTCHIVYHTLVVYYHAHCSIAYMTCLLIRVGGIVISCDSEVINDRQDMEEGGTREGRRSGEWEKVNRKRRNGRSIYLHGQHWTEFLTNSCMFAYE